MKNSVLVLPVIAGTVCCLAGIASAQVASTSNRAPVVTKHVGTEGVGFADSCGAAPSVGDGTYSYDLSSASNDFAASCGSSASAADMWVAYTATQDGLATATTCGLAGSDTVLAVLDGCGGGEIICNDDACGLQSSVSWSITTGTTYYVRIAGYNGNLHAGQVAISSIGGGTPANDDCANAESITDGDHAFNTTFATDDGFGSCGGLTDVWFKYTAATDGTLTASTCNTTAYDTVLAAFDGCGGSELACNDDTCGLQSQIAVPVSAGDEVWIRVSGYAGATGAGSVAVQLREPCVIDRPSGAINEEEDCGGDTNGGCNNAEGSVTQVSVDTQIAGTYWADANFRDTDWYEFTLSEDRDLTVTAIGGGATRIFILDALCAPTIIATNASAFGCEETSVSAFLSAGTYRVFCGVDAFAGLPCGGGNNDYVLTIGNAPTGCPADFNGDGFLDFFDYDDYVNCFETGTCPDGRTADFNGDDFVDFFDYDDYVAAFELGC